MLINNVLRYNFVLKIRIFLIQSKEDEQLKYNPSKR